MNTQKGYTNKEVAEALNMKPATVAYYTNKRYISPDVADPKGRGTTRRYSKRNMVELLLIKELSKHGLSLEKVLEVLRLARSDEYPREKARRYTGGDLKPGEFNLWDVLDFDNPFLRQIGEAFIIIYDHIGELSIDLQILPKRRLNKIREIEDEASKKAEIQKQIKPYLFFKIDMDKHDSALVINMTELWERVVKL